MKQLLTTDQFKRLLSYFLLAISVIAAYKLILEIDTILGFVRSFIGIISPFIYGFLIAYILNIPCGGIQKLLSKMKLGFISRKRKLFSVIITYLILVLMVILVFRLVMPIIYDSISLFFANFPIYLARAEDFVNYINDLDILNTQISMDTILSAIRSFGIEQLPTSILTVFSVPSAFFKGFLAFISSIYILFEKETFKNFLCRMLKAVCSTTVYRFILKYSRDLNTNFKQYIYTQTIDGCILGTIATIELHLLGSQYAVLLGLMLGIVNYIPYFGSIFGSLIAIVVVALTQGIPVALLTSVILLITQQIDGNIIQPKLMGGSFSLSPLLVIISITIGGAVGGVLGMIAAIPIVAVLKDMMENSIKWFEARKAREAESAAEKDNL